MRFDATFGVISSGNYEIFVRRHRESQTLYISPVIDSSAEDNPAHYKLHTGLYIISYLDAENRAMQLDKMLQVPEDQWLPRYLHSYHRDSFKYVKHQHKRAKKDNLKKIQCIDEVSTLCRVLIQEIQHCDFQQILTELKTASRISLRFQAGDLAGSGFHPFRRKNFPSLLGTSPESTSAVIVSAGLPNDIDDPDVENNDIEFDTDSENFSDSEVDCYQTTTGILKIEIKKKLGGHAYRGTISQAKGSTQIQYSGEIIIKLATTRDRKTSLRNEFAAYAQLAQDKDSSSCIVDIYGLFTSRFQKYSKTAYEVLIMADGGSSLDDRLKSPTSRETKARFR